MHVWNRLSRLVLTVGLICTVKTGWAQDGDTSEAESPDAVESEAPSEDAEAPPADEPAAEEPPVAEPSAEEPPPPEEAAPAEPPSLSEPIGGQPAATTPPPPMTTVPATPLAPPPTAAATAPVTELPPPAPVNEEPAAESSTASDDAATEPKVPGPMSETADEDEDDSWFSWFSFSPQVGYAFFPKADYTVNGLKFGVENRNSFVAKLHLDLGGDGLAFELTPLFATEVIGGDLSSFGDDVSGGISGNFFTVGGQMTIAVRGSWGKKFFPHLGVGFHGAYIFGDDIEYGAELYGRFPAGFTWQFAKHLGLVVEFAFMVGATGIRKPIPSTEELYAELEAEYGIDQEQLEEVDWSQYQSEADLEQLRTDLGTPDNPITPEQMDQIIQDQVSKAIKFGSGVAFELMVGIRFP